MIDFNSNYVESVVVLTKTIAALCGQCGITKQSAWRWVGLPPGAIKLLAESKTRAKYYNRLTALKDFLEASLENGDMPRDLTVDWIKDHIGE